MLIPRLLCVVIFALWVIPVSAQMSPLGAGDTNLGGINTISGTVIANGTRIQRRVAVRLQTMTRGDRIVITDENGNFRFSGLNSGDYTLVIDKEKEFRPFSQVVTIMQTRGMPGQTYNISIRLEYNDVASTKPGVLNVEFANVPKPALLHYDNAVELGKKDENLAAIDELKLAIKEYPSFIQAFNELGVQYLKLDKLEDADAALQGALKIDPTNFPALINRGIANVMMKRHGEAVPILRKALKKNDQSAVGHYFLGQALANLGLFDEAEKELVAALQMGKEEMKEAHRMLAIIYSSRKDGKKAADELELYLQLTPNTPDAVQLREKIKQLRESNQ